MRSLIDSVIDVLMLLCLPAVYLPSIFLRFGQWRIVTGVWGPHMKTSVAIPDCSHQEAMLFNVVAIKLFSLTCYPVKNLYKR